MGIAPAPQLPERVGNTYERMTAPSAPGNRGQLRFEEGLGTDPAVGADFMQGAGDGYITPPGRPNHNSNVYEKPAAQTMAERAHPGSAAWVESQNFLTQFQMGVSEPPVTYAQVDHNGGHQQRSNPAVITD